MKLTKRVLGLILVALIVVSALPVAVSANAGLAPNLVVIVLSAPEDTEVSLILPAETETETTVWKSNKVWETHFRFWYDREMRDMDGVYILVQSSEKEFQCELPMDHKGVYEELLTIFRSCFIPFVVQFIACAVFQKWYVRILPVAIMFLVLLTNFCLIILEARGNHDFSTYYLSEGFGLTDQWVIFLLGFFMLPIQLCGWWPGHALGKLLRAKKISA